MKKAQASQKLIIQALVAFLPVPMGCPMVLSILDRLTGRSSDLQRSLVLVLFT